MGTRRPNTAVVTRFSSFNFVAKSSESTGQLSMLSV